MSNKLNAAQPDDVIDVIVKLKSGESVRTHAYLSPEFDDYGFLRVLGQKRVIVVHRDAVEYFTYFLIGE